MIEGQEAGRDFFLHRYHMALVDLYKTARNAAINYLRHRATCRIQQHEMRYLNVISEEIILTRCPETHQLLFTAFRPSHPQCSKVFPMFYLEGKCYRQFANELQLSIYAVRNQKVRVSVLLRGKRNPLVAPRCCVPLGLKPTALRLRAIINFYFL